MWQTERVGFPDKFFGETGMSFVSLREQYDKNKDGFCTGKGRERGKR